MFAKTSIQPLFPTNVWRFEMPADVASRINFNALAKLEELTAPLPPAPPGQNWQTDQTLHELEDFKEVVELFEAGSRHVLDQLEVEYQNFIVTACWANLSPKGSFHIAHSHPNNFLSGVYYARTASGGDTINFHDPRPQQDIMAPPVKRHNRFNSTRATIQVQPGHLVVFPAWFVHSVSANMSDVLRVSISFNMMFEPYATTISRPKWTGLPLKAPTRGEAKKAKT